MPYSNSKVFDIVYRAMTDAGFDAEIANATATRAVEGAGCVIERRNIDAYHDRYISRVIESARIATMLAIASQ